MLKLIFNLCTFGIGFMSFLLFYYLALNEFDLPSFRTIAIHFSSYDGFDHFLNIVELLFGDWYIDLYDALENFANIDWSSFLGAAGDLLAAIGELLVVVFRTIIVVIQVLFHVFTFILDTLIFVLEFFKILIGDGTQQ